MQAFKRSAGIMALALGLTLSLPVAADHHMQSRNGMPYGPGQGMGPEMMQGYGAMMGYGPMMGYGMGMGMMHGGPMVGMGMAGMGMGGMGMMPCPMMGGLQGGPNGGVQLDEQQQQKMNRIREKFWQQQQEHMQTMWDHHNRMQSLWQDGKADNDKVLDAHRQMQKSQLEMLEQRLKLQQEMDEILTEEQRKQLWQMQRQLYRGGQ